MKQPSKKKSQKNRTLAKKKEDNLLPKNDIDKLIKQIQPYKELNQFFNFTFDFLPNYYQDTIITIRGMLVDINLVENQNWKFERIYLSKTQAPSVEILLCINDLMESFNIELKEWDLKRLCSIKEKVWVLRNSQEYNKGVGQIYANKKKSATKTELFARDLDIIDKLIRENPDITQDEILKEINKALGINLTRHSTIVREYLLEEIERTRKSYKEQQSHPLFNQFQNYNTFIKNLGINRSPLFKNLGEINRILQSAYNLITPNPKLIESARISQEYTNKIRDRYNLNQKIGESEVAEKSQIESEQVEHDEDKTR